MPDIIGQILKCKIGGRRKRKAIKGVVANTGLYSRSYKCALNRIWCFNWRESKEGYRFWSYIYYKIQTTAK